jgi:hypothetical protein
MDWMSTTISAHHLLDDSMDGRVFVYLLPISVVAGLLFVLTPTAHLSQLDINGTLGSSFWSGDVFRFLDQHCSR